MMATPPLIAAFSPFRCQRRFFAAAPRHLPSCRRFALFLMLFAVFTLFCDDAC